jgi:TatA/E family protein of Tat protein translocase
MFELLIIAVVLLLVFGASKVRSAGSDLGAAVKGFRKAVRAPQPPRPAPDPHAKPDPSANAPGTLPDAEFPEVLAGRARGSGKPGA